MVPFYVEPMVI